MVCLCTLGLNNCSLTNDGEAHVYITRYGTIPKLCLAVIRCDGHHQTNYGNAIEWSWNNLLVGCQIFIIGHIRRIPTWT